jgi:hypothetical protein
LRSDASNRPERAEIVDIFIAKHIGSALIACIADGSNLSIVVTVEGRGLEPSVAPLLASLRDDELAYR